MSFRLSVLDPTRSPTMRSIARSSMATCFVMEYIRNWNLLLDLKIMFLTVFGRKKNNLAPGKDIALEFQRIVGSTR